MENKTNLQWGFPVIMYHDDMNEPVNDFVDIKIEPGIYMTVPTEDSIMSHSEKLITLARIHKTIDGYKHKPYLCIK